MSHTGTMRGTPKNRNPATAQFANSPSGIPRPALESQVSHVSQSDAGTSTLSASRAKMSKRDEVSATDETFNRVALIATTTGHSPQDRDGSKQEEEPRRTSAPNEKGTPWHRSRPQAESSPPDQALDDSLGSSPVDGCEARGLCFGHG